MRSKLKAEDLSLKHACRSPAAAAAAGMQWSSSYLNSSVCRARSCWAAARAARLWAKLCWEVSDPEPPRGVWDWGSAEGWAANPASTGGKGGWKAGEVCCFLPKVLLPLRRVWSECLLGVLHRDRQGGVKETNRTHWSQSQKLESSHPRETTDTSQNSGLLYYINY